jgi:hypothetical protein
MKYSLPAGAPRITTRKPGLRSAMGRIVAGSDLRARSVCLVWFDPISGQRLSIEMMATPDLIRRLESEGFSVEPEITRSVG